MNNYNTYSDEELLGLLREKKPLCDHAFYVIYNRYSIKLNTYCMFFNKTKEVAEDVFQETWIGFDKAIKSGRQINNVFAFLVSVSRNLSIDKQRNLKSRKVTETVNIENIALNEKQSQYRIDSLYENAELIDLIEIAANNLDEKYKETFILKRFCDLPYKEIAEITGNSVDSIKKRSSRAMEMIKEMLKPYIKELS